MKKRWKPLKVFLPLRLDNSLDRLKLEYNYKTKSDLVRYLLEKETNAHYMRTSRSRRRKNI